MKDEGKRIIRIERGIGMGDEFLTVPDFIAKVQAVEKELADAGFTTVQVAMLADGEYEERYDYLAVVATRTETDAEYAERLAEKQKRVDAARKSYEARLAKARAAGYASVAAHQTAKHTFPCQNTRCKNTVGIDERRTNVCPRCGMVQNPNLHVRTIT